MYVLTALLTLLVSVSAIAEPLSCSELKSDLKSFQEAQEQILTSLAQNHEIAADTLQGYSELVVVANGSTPLDLSANMSDSAKAFRTRGEKAVDIAAQLQKGTSELMKRVQICLEPVK